MNDSKNAAKGTAKKPLALALTKSERKLEQLREAKRRKDDEFRKVREGLAAAAALEKALARKAERIRLKRAEAAMAGRLGRMVLAALRRQGLSGELLRADEIAGWSPVHLQELRSILAESPSDEDPLEDLAVSLPLPVEDVLDVQLE